jgi:voltage-gated potassium channel
MTGFLKFVNKYINWLIWTSIGLLFVELAFGKENSVDSSLWLFLWIERITAAMFMAEYFIRWYEDHVNPDGHEDIGHHYYPFSLLGIVDLVSWLPWVLGFFVPVHWLGWIRALRILRAFKLFRYNTNLQLMAIAFSRAWQAIKPMVFAMSVFMMLGSVLIHQAEKDVQPEKYGSILNCFWFSVVSATTVGYGDMSPVTSAGKIICMVLFFIPMIFSFSAIISVCGTKYQEVIEDHRSGKLKLVENI